MQKKNINYSIITAGVNSCSGGCSYCSAASSAHYTMGINYAKDLIAEVGRVMDANEQEMELDFPALEKTLLNDIKNVKKIDDTTGFTLHIDLWGADGLNNWVALQEEIAFFEDFCKEHKMKLDPHTSTNGLPFIRDDILPWLKEHKVYVQLSHDGLGQWMRTKDLDPMDLPNLREAMRCGILNWINTTLNFWNPSLIANRRYWLTKLREIFPEVFDDMTVCSDEIDKIYRALFIKLNHIYNSDYDIKSKNIYGRFSGKEYDSLKGEEIGDLQLSNRLDLAEKYGIPELGHVLDDYIAEWDKVYHTIIKSSNDDPTWIPFKSYITSQAKRWKELPHDDSRHRLAGACHAYQTNKNFDSNLGRSTTFVIDTLGNYCECNLIDSRNHVLNPTAQQPEYCNNCKYKYQHECNGCGSMQYPKKCEYLYRWVQWLESIHNEGRVYESIGESNNIKGKQTNGASNQSCKGQCKRK